MIIFYSMDKYYSHRYTFDLDGGGGGGLFTIPTLKDPRSSCENSWLGKGNIRENSRLRTGKQPDSKGFRKTSGLGKGNIREKSRLQKRKLFLTRKSLVVTSRLRSGKDTEIFLQSTGPKAEKMSFFYLTTNKYHPFFWFHVSRKCKRNCLCKYSQLFFCSQYSQIYI